ncbi:YciI family protein [Thalassotalea sp. M1531]|uniref:YciI family protein n=1 Tax=Thalassotalea algicola TaxID=2716224 RepID=A0A7Y0L9C8_9GAMM|nr:YciI-like protein [Thalassotalea algicola]NMP30044.1 YciI family protein [Thalassotalea algicola]
MYFLLTYDVVPDYLSAREQYREQHIQLARTSAESGELCLGGALSNPTDSAVLLFKGTSEKVARDFALNDPYVIHGLVKHWTVREWNIVIGAGVDSIGN